MKLDAITGFSLAFTGTDGLDFVGDANYQVGRNTGVQEPKETESGSDPALNRPAQGEVWLMHIRLQALSISAAYSCPVECRDLIVEVQAKGQAPLSCLYSDAVPLAGLARLDHQLLGKVSLLSSVRVHLTFATYYYICLIISMSKHATLRQCHMSSLS